METTITISWPDVVVAIVALWGAVLSTVIFIRDLRKEKSKIRVKTSFSFLTFPNSKADPKICVTAMNAGNVPVTLSSVHIAMPNGKNYVQIHSPTSPQLPFELQPRKNYSHFFDEKVFIAKAKESGILGKIKICPYFSDQMDNKYWSKPYKIEIK
jgi:hypothetical protein